MKTLYFECTMGAAGDMLTGALLDLTEDKQAFLDTMNRIGLPGVTVAASDTLKCGIRGTHVCVKVNGMEETDGSEAATAIGHVHQEPDVAGNDGSAEAQPPSAVPAHQHEHHAHDHAHLHAQDCGHHHAALADIKRIVEKLDVPHTVRADVISVYTMIAEAEGSVHGKPAGEIHFHEVGTLDALADITGVCLLIRQIAPERILASPVCTGSGHVHCAHGILPVPAPATAYLLRGIPSYAGTENGELCTPTGAALLKHFVSAFEARPAMRTDRIGYGMGTKDFSAANCVRAFLGQSDGSSERIIELRCNLDDMTPEATAFAVQRLFAAGALDVYTQTVGMKKCRTGVMLTCMCRTEDRDRLLHRIFAHTTTLGVREYECSRYTLQRSERELSVSGGTVRVKTASGWGVERQKAEYDDVARLAERTGSSFMQTTQMLQAAARQAKAES